MQTNLDAPNKRVVKVAVEKPDSKNWEDVIAETENVLNVSTASGYIFAKYMVDAVSKVKQYDFNGKLVRDIELPTGVECFLDPRVPVAGVIKAK